MSWNNIIPAWALNIELNEATEAYRDGEISQQEVYDRIKDIKEVPDYIKNKWKPDKED